MPKSSNSSTRLPSPEEYRQMLVSRRRNALNIPELQARQAALEDTLNAQTIVLEAFKAQQALMDQVAELPIPEIKATVEQYRDELGNMMRNLLNELYSVADASRESSRTAVRDVDQALDRAVSTILGAISSIPAPVKTDLTPVQSELTDIRRNMVTEIPNQQIQVGPLDIKITDRDDDGNVSRISVYQA